MKSSWEAFFDEHASSPEPETTGVAGMSVSHLSGGTAGYWGDRAFDLDETEIMAVAQKTVA